MKTVNYQKLSVIETWLQQARDRVHSATARCQQAYIKFLMRGYTVQTVGLINYSVSHSTDICHEMNTNYYAIHAVNWCD